MLFRQNLISQHRILFYYFLESIVIDFNFFQLDCKLPKEDVFTLKWKMKIFALTLRELKPVDLSLQTTLANFAILPTVTVIINYFKLMLSLNKIN